MFQTSDPETFWLTTTNITLGLVVLACLIIVGRGVFQELRQRIARRAPLPTTESRAMVIPLVGITMADGGQPVVGPAPRKSNKPSDVRPGK